MASKCTRKSPKRALALPDLELAKTAVVNSLSSETGQRTYEHAIAEFVRWYCSEPRLAFNRTVVLRYRIHLEQRGYARRQSTSDSRRFAESRTKPQTLDCSVQSSRQAFDTSRARGASVYASETGCRPNRVDDCWTRFAA
jgi:hypothetical protein